MFVSISQGFAALCFYDYKPKRTLPPGAVRIDDFSVKGEDCQAKFREELPQWGKPNDVKIAGLFPLCYLTGEQ
ncbi:hypothetical protein GCM10027185_22990 [Spirosoma pulveris]